MAVFCLSVLLALLAVAALVTARPWEDTSVVPNLGLAPDLGVALGDAVGLPPVARPALADARPVPGGGSAPISMKRAAGSTAAAPSVAVAEASPVAQAAPAPSADPPSQPPSAEPAPASPEPAPAPVALPVAPTSPQTEAEPYPAVLPPEGGKPSTGGGSHRPGTAGVDLGFPFAAFKVEEGGVYLLSTSFRLGATALPPPGEDNLLLQFNSTGGAAPSFGLQLWDDRLGGRGLWSSGAAMGGERFLAPLAESHRFELYFQASSEGAGFYLAFLDGKAIDARAGVSLIEPGSERATVKVGLFRDGEFVPAGPEVAFVAASLADAPEPLAP